ncbi:MAG: hypothetical protein KAU62_08255 [Candidatus Heimdallarchaeota archaeon]|nr:hypothetical protein [Candidatus Heimdallarchaeota archaeon]MCG3256063.1 hypothetical protein [Candidatus Heimdallarchaeota archaeon]MCK4611133.1 hypothetical protein [Candidatus Heimdallarchaeota archaeon]
MVVEIGEGTLQYILDLVLLILLYASKTGIWIGLMITTEKTSKGLIQRNLGYSLNKIGKGIGIIIFSLIIYLLLV